LTHDRNDAKLVANVTKEATAMGNAAAVKKYHQKLDEFKIRPRKEEGQVIRQYAADKGISVQELFLTAVREHMELNK
jgi:hypothetical protein